MAEARKAEKSGVEPAAALVPHNLDAARKHAKWDADAAAIAWAQDRIKELEDALGVILTIGDLEPNRPLGEAHYFARKALRR